MSLGYMELTLQPGVVLTNMHVSILHEIRLFQSVTANANNFQIEIQLYKKFATIVRPFLIKFEQDFCEFVGKKNSSILYHLLFLDEMKKWGNFYDPCPISV